MTEARGWDGRPPNADWHWIGTHLGVRRMLWDRARQHWRYGPNEKTAFEPVYFVNNGYTYLAPCQPPAAPCADEVEAMVRAVENVYFGGSTAKDELALVMRAALAALAPLRQAERERAWRDGAEAMREAMLDAADEGHDVDKLVSVLLRMPLQPPPAQGGQKL